MGLFKRMRAIFHDDWCSQCQHQMDVLKKQLYALPTMRVGHYTAHEEPEYYKENLIPVEKKAQIPTGMYACGIHVYQCPQCGHRAVKLTVLSNLKTGSMKSRPEMKGGFYIISR